MPGISLYEYLAYNSDPEVSLAARDVVKSYGYNFHGTSRESLLAGLKGFVQEEGEQGLKSLAMIHPDRDLILSTASGTMSADGFAQSVPYKTPADGQAAVKMPTNADNAQKQNDHTPLLIAGFFFSVVIVCAVVIHHKK